MVVCMAARAVPKTALFKFRSTISVGVTGWTKLAAILNRTLMQKKQNIFLFFTEIFSFQAVKIFYHTADKKSLPRSGRIILLFPVKNRKIPENNPLHLGKLML